MSEGVGFYYQKSGERIMSTILMIMLGVLCFVGFLFIIDFIGYIMTKNAQEKVYQRCEADGNPVPQYIANNKLPDTYWKSIKERR